jgi:hypothetical protein
MCWVPEHEVQFLADYPNYLQVISLKLPGCIKSGSVQASPCVPPAVSCIREHVNPRRSIPELPVEHEFQLHAIYSVFFLRGTRVHSCFGTSWRVLTSCSCCRMSFKGQGKEGRSHTCRLWKRYDPRGCC